MKSAFGSSGSLSACATSPKHSNKKSAVRFVITGEPVDGLRVTSVSATQELIDIYPQSIRSWIARRGGLSPHMKFLRGRDLTAFYPMCGSESQRTETTRATHNRGGRAWRSIAISASARSASGH